MAVLSRCLQGKGLDGIEEGFRTFEATRKERTSKIQYHSHLNKWMKQKTDPGWVYGYDAWSEPLARHLSTLTAWNATRRRAGKQRDERRLF